jgi:hypothetical protein
VVQNDITREYGAIAYDANSQLDHFGEIAKAISDKGGNIINE